MRQLIANLTSASWWLSVAVVSVAFNVLSVYIVRRLDSRLSRTSSWWRKLSHHKEAQKEALIAKLKGDSHGQLMMGFETIYTQVYFQVFTILAAMLMILQIAFLIYARMINSRSFTLASMVAGFCRIICVVGTVTWYFKFQRKMNIIQAVRSEDF